MGSLLDGASREYSESRKESVACEQKCRNVTCCHNLKHDSCERTIVSARLQKLIEDDPAQARGEDWG